MVLSHLVHRQEYSRPGFGRCDWKDLMIEVGRPLALLRLLLTACGLLLHTMRAIRLGGAGPLPFRPLPSALGSHPCGALSSVQVLSV
jgi:hypothetical protein